MREQVERICISVNTECNLGCKYCYFLNHENRILKESILSVDEIFTILKKNKEIYQLLKRSK
jgi:molybdenum cofactor biosynthesis enzyme MoaA